MIKKRCAWAINKDETYQKYHDEEWGRPVFEDQKLKEFLVLESAQAGLSWQTILNKRSGYKNAFKNFDPKKVSKFNDLDIERLMNDEKIVRNRLKIKATIANAKAFLAIQKEFGSFSNYLWGFVNNKPINNHWQSQSEVPTTTLLATKIAKDLKRRGFKFLGPTICYAYLQAVGVVNDHTTDCFCYSEISQS